MYLYYEKTHKLPGNLTEGQIHMLWLGKLGPGQDELSGQWASFYRILKKLYSYLCVNLGINLAFILIC